MSNLWHQAPVLSVMDEPHSGQHMGTDKRLRPHFWVSGMNLALTETWTWMSTGQPFTFTDWTPGQPDNWLDLAVGEHCVLFWEAGNYTWDNGICLDQSYFICEYYDL
ncbi:hypothetical protein J6590_048106 [Homalodisca vitripennis]|nr:hypothetical protein J6590_048106 [Homalodisca vitripennis]